MIGEEKSSQHPLNCGVPQGAILSPMLFNIYMRPLAQLVRSFGLGCHQYADDTQLYLMMDNRPNTPPTALTKCLEAVTIWLRQSLLKLNPQKTEVLSVGNKKPTDVEIRLPQLDGTTLTTSTTVKSLGVILDTSLSMEAQTLKVAHQAFYHLHQVK